MRNQFVRAFVLLALLAASLGYAKAQVNVEDDFGVAIVSKDSISYWVRDPLAYRIGPVVVLAMKMQGDSKESEIAQVFNTNGVLDAGSFQLEVTLPGNDDNWSQDSFVMVIQFKNDPEPDKRALIQIALGLRDLETERKFAYVIPSRLFIHDSTMEEADLQYTEIKPDSPGYPCPPLPTWMCPGSVTVERALQ